jgi:hypothetical protein
MYRTHALLQKSIAATAASTIWLLGMACVLYCLAGGCRLPGAAAAALTASPAPHCEISRSATPSDAASAGASPAKSSARKAHSCCHAKKSAQREIRSNAQTLSAAPPALSVAAIPATASVHSTSSIHSDDASGCCLTYRTKAQYLTASAPRIEPDHGVADLPARTPNFTPTRVAERLKATAHSTYRPNRSGTYLRCCVFLI